MIRGHQRECYRESDESAADQQEPQGEHLAQVGTESLVPAAHPLDREVVQAEFGEDGEEPGPGHGHRVEADALLPEQP